MWLWHIIIDPDHFSISPLPKQEIIRANKKKLLNLFISICLNGTDKFEPGELKAALRMDLSERNVDSKTDITHELSRKLKYVKKPIDYLTDIML